MIYRPKESDVDLDVVCRGRKEVTPGETFAIVKNMPISSTEEFDDEPLVQIDRFLGTRSDDEEFGNVRFIARHGRIFDVHGERRSIDFCGVMLQQLPFGKTVDVKMDNFAGKTETNDVTGSELGSMGRISQGRLRRRRPEQLLQDGSNRDEVQAMVKSFVHVDDQFIVQLRRRDDVHWKRRPSQCDSFLLHMYEIGRDLGFKGEHIGQ